MPGYTEFKAGRFFKLIATGEGENNPAPGSFLEVKMQTRVNDSILFSSEFENPLGHIILPFSEESGFGLMKEGDSAEILLPAGDLSVFGKDSMMKMHVSLLKIHRQLPESFGVIKNEYEEKLFIERFIKSKKLNAKNFNGLYILENTEGTGESPVLGNNVSVRYSGYLLNGKMVDGTFGKSYDFTYGAEMQLIKGVEAAVGKLKPGGKIRVIIPSYLAFGESGSSNGSIKPNTPLIYEIELLKIN